MSVSIRPAVSGDEELIFSFILELAEYEKLSGEVVADEKKIAAALFCDQPRAFCELADWNGKPAGFTLWFHTYSTFKGRQGMYLEDLFVRPESRGLGIGKALLVNLARRCKRDGLGRFEWQVLDWNTPSIEFYKGLGAKPLDEWTMYRLTDDELDNLAGRSA